MKQWYVFYYRNSDWQREWIAVSYRAVQFIINVCLLHKFPHHDIHKHTSDGVTHNQIMS